MTRTATGRFLLLLSLWWLLCEGAVDSLWVGVPTAALALLPGIPHRAAASIKLLGLSGFSPIFLLRSLVAGADVAARALRPDMALHPALVEYRTELPPGPQLVFFANLVSLLPGTLSADIDDRTLQIHVLDSRTPSAPTLRRLEGVVARLYRQ